MFPKEILGTLMPCIMRLTTSTCAKDGWQVGGANFPPAMKASVHYLNPLFNFDGVSPLYSSG